MITIPSPGWYPRVSPTGLWVAYQGSGASGHPAIRLVDVRTGKESLIDPIPTDRNVASYMGGWFSDTEVLYIVTYREDHKGPYELWMVNVLTLARSLYAALPVDWLDGVRVVASKGHWAAGCGHSVIVDGVRWSDDLHWRISLDGEHLYVVTTRGLEHWTLGARVETFPVTGAVTDTYPNGRYVGYGYGQCRLIDLVTGQDTNEQINPPPNRESAPWVVDGWTWSAREQPTTLVMGRPLHEEKCIQVSIPESVVYLHVVKTPTEWVVATNGDRGQMCVQTVPLDAPRDYLVPETPAQPVTPTAPLPRDVWMGYYKTMGRYGDLTQDVLNLGVNILILGTGECDTSLPYAEKLAQFNAAATQAVSANAGLLVGADLQSILEAKPYWSRVCGVLIGTAEQRASEVEQLVVEYENIVKELGIPRRPVCWYVDGPITADRYRHPVGVDVQALNLYLGPESPSESATAVRELRALYARQAALVPANVGIALVAQAYDRNGVWENITALMDMQPVYAEFARADARVQGLWWFSYGRKGGSLDYPELIEWHKSILAANPGTPPITGNTMPSPNTCPKVVDSPVSKNGKYTLVMQDDGNLVIYVANGKPIWASNSNQ